MLEQWVIAEQFVLISPVKAFDQPAILIEITLPSLDVREVIGVVINKEIIPIEIMLDQPAESGNEDKNKPDRCS